MNIAAKGPIPRVELHPVGGPQNGSCRFDIAFFFAPGSVMVCSGDLADPAILHQASVYAAAALAEEFNLDDPTLNTFICGFKERLHGEVVRMLFERRVNASGGVQ